MRAENQSDSLCEMSSGAITCRSGRRNLGRNPLKVGDRYKSIPPKLPPDRLTGARCGPSRLEASILK